MPHKFTTELDQFSKNGTHCDKIEVSIYLDCRTRDGECTSEIEYIYNVTTDELITFDQLNEDSQTKIVSECQDIADNNRDGAYEDYLAYEGDCMHDYLKEQE